MPIISFQRLKWFWVSILFLLFFSVHARAQSTGPNTAYSGLARQVKPSVVTVMVYDYTGRLKHIGSGFFCNSSGDLVTNSHVLAKNSMARIKTRQGKTFAVGGIIHRDEKADVVQARTHVHKKVPFLSPAKRRPSVGERIMVAGSPMGLEQTITEGIVSAWREIPGKGRVIQISAPISPGSSGGPVLNMKGEVVGIAAFQSVKGQNLNFAIPVDRIFKKSTTTGNRLTIQKDKSGAIIIQ